MGCLLHAPRYVEATVSYCVSDTFRAAKGAADVVHRVLMGVAMHE